MDYDSQEHLIRLFDSELKRLLTSFVDDVVDIIEEMPECCKANTHAGRPRYAQAHKRDTAISAR